MSPDQIISAVWKLKWYEVAQVAIQDDLILFVKIWPVWLLLIVSALLVIWDYD